MEAAEPADPLPCPDWGRQLRTTIRLAEPLLAASTSRFWSQSTLARWFPEYLFCVYCSAQGTLSAMEVAYRRARMLAADDSAARLLAAYLEAHLAEERDHPAWLLADLEALGIPREETLSRTPPPGVATLVGAPLFWIDQVHPVAILGLLAILEGFPPAISWLESIQRKTDLPREAFRFLAAHAEIDPHHAADLWRLLDHLPMNEALGSLVGLAALHTVGALGDIFDSLSSKAEGDPFGR